MQIHHAFQQSTGHIPSICTIGTFDGVHLGHQQLIRATINEAQARKAQSVVITFHPHPRVALGRGSVSYLTSPQEKAAQMQQLGVDVLLVLPFTQQTAQTPALQFVEWMRTYLDLQSLWIGHDFALGHKRQGNAAFLSEQGRVQGFSVNVLPQFSLGAHTISSTRVRMALAQGDVRDANLCLGRPFRVTCEVHGIRQLYADAQHALPAPGCYSVMIDGVPNEAAIVMGELQVGLRQPFSTDRGVVAVDFHDLAAKLPGD